jgi:hypothetical protein
MFLVPLDVSIKFAIPIVSVALRPFSVLTVRMLVPEASVNENDFAMSWQHDIRFPR